MVGRTKRKKTDIFLCYHIYTAIADTLAKKVSAICILMAFASQKFLDIPLSVVDFTTDLDGNQNTGFCPVMERGVAYTEFLHYFLLRHQTFGGVFTGNGDYFIKYPLNNFVGEVNEVLIFYGNVEIGDAAFNKSFEV